MIETAFNPFVVFGASKSGTTWLQRLIDYHPECRCHFQTLILPFPKKEKTKNNQYTAIYNGKQSPFRGVFKSELEEKQYHWKNELLAQQTFLTRNYISTLVRDKEKAEYLSEYIKPLIRATIQSILVDDGGAKKAYGTKAYTDLEQLLHIFPNAKIITIIRDGRDVVVSKRFHALRMKVFFHGDEKYHFHYLWNKSVFLRKVLSKLNQKWIFLNEKHFKNLNESRNLLSSEALKKYTTEWASIVEYILKVQKTHPENILSIHYSKLYNQTEEELHRVFDFLGVQASEGLLKEIIRSSQLPQKEKDSFFRKGGSGDWKNYFVENHKSIFKELAGSTLIQLGFEQNDDW